MARQGVDCYGAGQEASVVRQVHSMACCLGVPPGVAVAVAIHESGGRPLISAKGAKGIMQVLPRTARRYGLDETRLLEEEYGIYAGVVVLGDLLQKFSFHLAPALAAYYAGERFAENQYSSETEADILNYVKAVLARAKKYDRFSCACINASR